jgi:hypothetical protein
MNNLIITRHPLAYYIEKLQSNTPFCFIRYGDGEFQAMGILDHIYNWNCDKHEYFPELEIDLRETLIGSEPNLIRAIGHKATENGKDAIAKYLISNNCSLQWDNTEVFLDSSIEGALNPLIKYIRSKKTLYLCSEKLTTFVKKELDVDYVITVPLINSYLDLGRIEREVLELLENNDVDLILMSAGFLTKVLFYRLFVLRQVKINMLDLGSVFDGYVKHRSRSHVKHLAKKSIAKNLSRK